MNGRPIVSSCQMKHNAKNSLYRGARPGRETMVVTTGQTVAGLSAEIAAVIRGLEARASAR